MLKSTILYGLNEFQARSWRRTGRASRWRDSLFMFFADRWVQPDEDGVRRYPGGNDDCSCDHA